MSDARALSANNSVGSISVSATLHETSLPTALPRPSSLSGTTAQPPPLANPNRSCIIPVQRMLPGPGAHMLVPPRSIAKQHTAPRSPAAQRPLALDPWLPLPLEEAVPLGRPGRLLVLHGLCKEHVEAAW